MEIIRRTDLEFLLFDWLKAGSFHMLARFGGQTEGDYRAILDLSERVAKNAFLPSFKAGDRDEPQLAQDSRAHVHPEIAKAVRSFFDAGLHLATVDLDKGGLQLPTTVATAVMSYIMAANVAAAGFPVLSIANTRVLLNFGSPSQIEVFARPQLEGKALGTMCLSEPDVGSSLGDITTRAISDGEDILGWRYRLTGRKMWISGGSQNITENTIHLVLAKIAEPNGKLPHGSKGTSLFIVPTRLPNSVGGHANDVVVAGLNHKMGFRGIPNCALNFGDNGEGAIGWLIGKPGEGLRIMFQMMNEARINIGLGGAALAYRGYLLSLNYSMERRQGRPLGQKGPGSPVPIVRHPDVRRMILAQKAIAEGALALCLYSAKLSDIAQSADEEFERSRAQGLLELLTPVTKTWPSEMGLVANNLAIQIHGGYGYTRDFDVEQIYRDNRLNPIHEGTTGIQGIDLLGRKILFDDLQSFAEFVTIVRDTIDVCEVNPKISKYAATLEEKIDRLEIWIKSQASKDVYDQVLSGATPFLFAFGHLVVGWLWLDMTRAALDGQVSDTIQKGKLAACSYFFDYEMPLIDAWLAPLQNGSTVVLTIEEDVL